MLIWTPGGYHRDPMPPSPFRSAAALILAAALCALSPPAHAQPSGAGRDIAAHITGATFSGLRLPGQSRSADASFAATRVWTWSIDDPTVPGRLASGGDGGGGGEVQRLLLQGDVSVELGEHHFTAAQACVWIQRLPDAADAADPAGGGGEGGAHTRQFAIYFDRVADPAAAVGFSQAGDRLLVTGILRGGVTLAADSLRRGRPEVLPTTRDVDPVRIAAAFTAEGEQRLARHLRRLEGLGDETSPPTAGEPEAADLAAAGRGADVYGPLRPIRPGLSRVYEPNSPMAMSVAEGIRQVGSPPPQDLPPVEKLEPIFAGGGIISFAAGNDRTLNPDIDENGERTPIRLVPGENGADNTLLLSGGVVVQYTDTRKNRNLQVSAERAVVFLQPGPVTQLTTFGADAVKGIYLEGDVVATDGRYTVRGPKVYYDLATQQAVMIDAVFWTYDEQRGLPLYVRAKEIRQLAANQWQARSARLATTSFFDPVFSLGASSVTITRRTDPNQGAGGHGRSRRGRAASTETGDVPDLRGDTSIAGGVATGATVSGRTGGGGGGGGAGDGVSVAGTDDAESTYLDARDITLRAGGVPFFWVPRARGEVENIPLKDLRIENSSSSGTAFKTGWDPFSVLGARSPRGLDSTALLDWYFDRGPALGYKGDYRSPDGDSQANFFAYTLPDDYGRDVLSSGAKRGIDNEFRGMVLADYSVKLDDKWALQLEGSAISDENFVDAFFRPLAYSGREITNSAYLKRQTDHTLFTVLAKGEFIDFTPNQYLLESQGFNVDKLPEAGYYRLADDLLDQSAPGALVWSQEYRVGRMNMNFTEPTAAELGFDTPKRAQAAFGFSNPNLSPADELRAEGYTEDAVTRADTRQELAGTFQYGVFKISPFLTGRFTAYDDTFESFRPKDGPNADSQYRYWYSAGVRTSTQITRINDAVDSQVFDLHRTRHIIEPSMTLWYAGSNLSQNDLPDYDDNVESIATGTVGNFNIAQTWQTKRGGPGRWHDVDVLKVNTGITGSTDDADRESPIDRFFAYRPEYSQLGNFLNADAAWQVTDVVALTFDEIYDLDIHQSSRTGAGAVIQHSPDFSSYAELRYINAMDSTYVNFGCDYKLTRRYLLGFNSTYDTDLNEFQSYNIRIRRRVPEANIGVSLGYDNITDETSFSLIFEPAAAPQAQALSQRLRDIGR